MLTREGCRSNRISQLLNVFPAHRFLVELLADGLKLLGLVFHFLALLVVIHSQLLQSLEDLLHFILGGLVLRLQTVQLCLEVLVIAARGRQELETFRKSGMQLLIFAAPEIRCE